MSTIVGYVYDGNHFSSSDYGASFTEHTGEENPWGCVAASEDAETLLITDTASNNAHGNRLKFEVPV